MTYNTYFTIYDIANQVEIKSIFIHGLTRYCCWLVLPCWSSLHLELNLARHACDAQMPVNLVVLETYPFDSLVLASINIDLLRCALVIASHISNSLQMSKKPQSSCLLTCPVIYGLLLHHSCWLAVERCSHYDTLLHLMENHPTWPSHCMMMI